MSNSDSQGDPVFSFSSVQMSHGSISPWLVVLGESPPTVFFPRKMLLIVHFLFRTEH